MTELARVSASALRAAVLAKLGFHEDPRTAQVLRDGAISIEHHVSEWEASSGRVIGHRVRVGAPASLLGALRGHPHVEDEVTRIIGVAVSDHPGEAASDVVFHHDLHASAPPPSTPYRGTSPRPVEPPVDLARLAYDYLAGFGDLEAAEMARRTRIEIATRHDKRGHPYADVHIALAPEDERAPRAQMTALESCLRDLLGGPASGLDVRLTRG